MGGANNQPLKVLTWNLYHGCSVPATGRGLAAEFCGLLQQWDWDVALLQEVPPWWPEMFARETGADYARVLTSRNFLLPVRRLIASYNPDLLKANGGGSNAILSRIPIASTQSVRLRFVPERRVAHMAKLADGTTIVNYHGSVTSSLATKELARLWDIAALWAEGGPVVLGGDLNLLLRQIENPQHMTHAGSSWVDHIYIGGGLNNCGPTELLDREVHVKGARALMGDHVPLRVTVGL